MLWRIQDMLVIDVYHHESSKHTLLKNSMHCVMALNWVGLKQKEQWAQKDVWLKRKHKQLIHHWHWGYLHSTIWLSKTSKKHITGFYFYNQV